MTRSAPSFIKRLTAGILVLNLSVVALAALSLSRSRQEYTERAGVTARNLSHVLEQYVIGVIGKVDVGLLAVTAEAQQQIARGGIDGQRLCAYMEREQTYLPELDSLRAIDSRGAFICRNGMTGKAVTAADRDFFIRLHDAPGSGVAISKPFKGRISGKWVIVVARRINRPDGSFAGVIAAAIALERINTIFAATDVGRHGSIVLLDGGGGLVVRYPERRVAGSPTGRAAVSRELQEMIRQGRTAGTYRARSGLDNVERTFSYRKASGYPLSIVVGLATGDYLSEWRSGVAQTSAFVALFCLITSFSAWLIYREWKRKNSAMADLLRQKAKYHTVADHTHAWEFWLSPDDSFVYTSPSCKRITGYDAEAFYADPGLLDRIVLPDDQGRYADHRHDVRSSTATHQLVIRIRHADGSIRWLEHVCQPIIDDGGVFHGTRGSNRDITERKRMEEALRESEDHFHQLFIQNWDAVTLLKQGTHDVLDANPAMIALFGYSLEELRDCGPWPIMAPDAAPEFLDFLRHAAAQGDASLEKIVCNGKDGIPRIISTKAKLIRLREEDVIYCSFRDISERIRLESANREAQAKLIHANKMSSLGMLVSGIAHEINNPNQYISLNASILAEIWGDATAILARYREECGEFTVKGLSFGQARETVPRLLTALTEGSRRISLIVNNLKDFCRDDSGRQQAAFDLNKTVHAAVQILTHHIHKHTDDFRLELAEDVPPVRGKVQQIEQVIINLITNALQALPEKGRGVRVGTRYERHGDTVVLTVRDEGRGMTQKLMERITEPFFSTRIEEGGTGLGLSISAAIIKEHDGTLEFESTPDLGTTATIRLHAAPSGSSAGSAGEGAGSR